MLAKFKVTNFKNFKEEFVLDLTDTKMYEFNTECVKNGVVNKALIYGRNGIGKSNLGYALFDFISHLSNKNSGSEPYKHYLNALNDSGIANFEYEFNFDGHIVLYKYGKINHETLVYENLSIDAIEHLSIDRRKSSTALFNFEGTESLKTEMGDSHISLVNYIKNNAVLAPSETNDNFFRFLKFIDGMLFFRSLHENAYIGFERGATGIAADIIEHENVQDFENFLNEAGIACKISTLDDGKDPGLAFVFEDKLIPFYEIASTGTRALTLFYYWLQRLRDDSNATLVFIDEFDAFYHHELSALLIRRLKELDAQIVLTTHNTGIMTNDILRPDCNFVMDEKHIKPLSNCTAKELRSAHNIEKMYRAGAFNG